MGELGQNMKPLRWQSTHIKGFGSSIKFGQIMRHFVRAEFFMFAILRQKCQYILSWIVLEIRKRHFLEKRGPNQGLFGSKDQFGRERVLWGKYEASKIAEYPYQRILL